MRKCIYLCVKFAQMHGSPAVQGLAGFPEAKKNPPKRVLSERIGLAGVHAPPEDVTEDDDLLFLHILEAVVLVRMLIAVEAAQTDTGRQAIELFHPQLTVVVDRIKVAINDVADPAFAGIDADRGAVAQHRQHAVAPYCHAFGLIELHTVMAQTALAEAQARALALFDDESS